MTTLADILLKTAFALKSLRNSLATGGSTTTLIDTNLSEPNDFFNGGTIFFLSGTLIGKTAIITDWNATTFTFTIPTQTAAVVSGVRYAIAESRYPRETMVQAINMALAELGNVLQRDETLITEEDLAEYQLPSGVSNIKRVQIATSDTEPFNWDAPHHWWTEWDGLLVFTEAHIPETADMPIRLWYEEPHEAVYNDADEISSAIYPERLSWTAAWLAALNRSGLAENSEPHSTFVAQLANQMRLMQAKHPITTMPRDARWADWG